MTYFAIPGHYTIGESFSTLREAVSEAAERIVRIREENERSRLLVPERSYVDERVQDAEGDRVIRRYTIESITR